MTIPVAKLGMLEKDGAVGALGLRLCISKNLNLHQNHPEGLANTDCWTPLQTFRFGMGPDECHF